MPLKILFRNQGSIEIAWPTSQRKVRQATDKHQDARSMPSKLNKSYIIDLYFQINRPNNLPVSVV